MTRFDTKLAHLGRTSARPRADREPAAQPCVHDPLRLARRAARGPRRHRLRGRRATASTAPARRSSCRPPWRELCGAESCHRHAQRPDRHRRHARRARHARRSHPHPDAMSTSPRAASPSASCAGRCEIAWFDTHRGAGDTRRRAHQPHLHRGPDVADHAPHRRPRGRRHRRATGHPGGLRLDLGHAALLRRPRASASTSPSTPPPSTSAATPTSCSGLTTGSYDALASHASLVCRSRLHGALRTSAGWACAGCAR